MRVTHQYRWRCAVVYLLPCFIIVSGNFPMSVPSSTQRIYQNCTTDTDCPLDSSCRPSGCDGYVCLCLQSYVASEDRTRCLKAVKVGDSCNLGDSRCISPFAMCQGTCQCVDVFVPTKDGRCKLPGINFVGENCGKCEFPATCVGGVCRCSEEFRPLSTEEFWLDPLSTLQCRPRDYSLSSCNGTNIADLGPKGQPGVTQKHAENADHPPAIQEQEVAIFGTCSSHAQCPSNAECRPSSCDGFICLCKEGFIASDNRFYCLRAKKVGEKCSTKTDRCLSPFAMCATSGVCECLDMFSPTKDGTCKLPGSNHVGEACTNSKQCEFPAVCDGGSCQCRKPYRETTRREFWLDPSQAIQCRPNDFSVWKCNGTDIKIPADLKISAMSPDEHDHNSHGGHDHVGILPDDNHVVTSQETDDHGSYYQTWPPQNSLLIPLNIVGLLAVAAFALIVAVIFKTKRRQRLKKHNIGSTNASSEHSSINDETSGFPNNAMKIPRPSVITNGSFGSFGSESWSSFSTVQSNGNHRYSPYLQSLEEWQRNHNEEQARNSATNSMMSRGPNNNDYAIYANEPL